MCLLIASWLNSEKIDSYMSSVGAARLGNGENFQLAGNMLLKGSERLFDTLEAVAFNILMKIQSDFTESR